MTAVLLVRDQWEAFARRLASQVTTEPRADGNRQHRRSDARSLVTQRLKAAPFSC